MLSINTNLSSLIAQGSMKQSTNKLNQAIERMTTGFKINHAKDNAANYSIATNMTTKIGAYNVAEDNAAMGLDLISTAEGTLSQIEDKLQRLRVLAEQASNGTYGEQSLNAINTEANALVDEINRLYETAEYNGLKLFGGSTEGGANDTMPIQTYSLARTSETITSVGFLEPVEHQDTSFATPISTLEEGALLDATQVYSISSAEDLEKLTTMYVEEWCIATCLKLILDNDVDMTSIDNWSGLALVRENLYDSFSIELDGNGYVIKNLTGERGLIAGGTNADFTVCDLGFENVNIVSSDSNDVGALISSLDSCNVYINNCYITGSINANNSDAVGGVLGYIEASGNDVQIIISDVVCDLDISATKKAGGIVGSMNDDMPIDVEILDSQYIGESTSLEGVFVGNADSGCSVTVDNCVYSNYYDTLGIPLLNGAGTFTVNNVTSIPVTTSGGTGSGTTPDTPTPDVPVTPPTFAPAPDTIVLQIGASSDWASQVGVSTKFSLVGVDDLRMIGLDLTTDYLTPIDDMLALVSEKQTHFGATSNRLESVLEEITIQRDNLVSSRSTIRDADIAEVSSHYIQQQILQQASATLLATANQSPSIALQLI